MKSSVVILNWNGEKLLEQFLPSVIANTPAEIAEIVVADNGSTDNSRSLLKEKFPAVKLIFLDKNYGFAGGYNKAIEFVDSEYVVLLNSDVEVTPDWIEAPLKILDNEANIAAVQPKVLSQRNKDFFEYAGAAGGFMDKYGYPFCRGRIFSEVEKDTGQYDTETDILWATGACLFIRTEVYKKEGGLDANFFAHQEEIDMCRRLRSRGYRIVYTPQSVVYHVGGATLTVENPHKTFLNFRNNLLMLYKNLSDKELKPVMRVRYWFDRIAALQFFIAGHPKNATAVFRARREFKHLKESYLEIRKTNLEKTVCHPIPEILQKSLLLQFYVKGKKRFSEINF
ncbi:MAG: glycosyltransferase family 2 protein [Tannerella sp.]|jgi:GT2 family glycosyltransferase|nr:glycosyltransferase family 2 protein [Tannerella sp.]